MQPELIDAFPQIENDFYRSPLTEDERNIAIHSCLNTISMNYNPPPLNKSASSANKKADSIFYGIKTALAQTTRLLDYYSHCRAQDNPGIDTFVDPEIMFASTMIALLSEVPATLTQVRLDALHKELDLPETPASS
ncbi:hypothetical protein AYI69_g4770 [Smittium culicis]|uniref:Uncharacterized protein n=1 Tax=Smittium culicis TaxID=133412 RepID=A0A1R1YAT5_9FUNG|nr:hypothetical protein AYI69_g4770 [Smittium culicis]